MSETITKAGILEMLADLEDELASFKNSVPGDDPARPALVEHYELVSRHREQLTNTVVRENTDLYRELAGKFERAHKDVKERIEGIEEVRKVVKTVSQVLEVVTGIVGGCI